MGPGYFIRMKGMVVEKLTRYLNTKRGEKMAYLGKPYTIRDMARELGLNERTLGRMMDYQVKIEGLDFDTLLALHKYFGDEILEVLGFKVGQPALFLPDQAPA
jgi:hypothetical protein